MRDLRRLAIGFALGFACAPGCGGSETESCVPEEGTDGVCPIGDAEREQIAERCGALCAARSDLASSCTFDVAGCQADCEAAAGPCPGKTVPWLECRVASTSDQTCACADAMPLDCTAADETQACVDLEGKLSACGG